ncbi:MAG: amidohydrolase family protein [Armatimonadota bacterium]|nr:amidohydrolase family protein [Armatimonadota bacterium]
MILDAYNHLWRARPNSPELFMHQALTPERLIAEMDRGGINMAVVCPLGQDMDNEYIGEAVRAYPDRLIGFLEVNPRDPDAPAQIHALVERYRFKGLKLHPTMMGHPVSSHPLMDPIMRVCAELGLAVYGHCMHDFWAVPLQYEELARSFPSVPVILGHMGIIWSVSEAGMVARRNPNVYLETSLVPLRSLKIGIQEAGAEKVLMGTDWPANDFDLQLEMVRRATGTAEAFELVAGGNLARILGIR